MGFQEILTAISTVGFPIVMCIILVMNVLNINKDLQETMKQLTEALTKLSEKIDLFTK